MVPWVCDGKESVGEWDKLDKKTQVWALGQSSKKHSLIWGVLVLERRKEDDGERRIGAGPWLKVIRPAHEGLKRNCPSSGVGEGNDVPCKPTAQG